METLDVADVEAGKHLDRFLVRNEVRDRAFPHAAGDLHDRGDQEAAGVVLGAAERLNGEEDLAAAGPIPHPEWASLTIDV